MWGEKWGVHKLLKPLYYWDKFGFPPRSDDTGLRLFRTCLIHFGALHSSSGDGVQSPLEVADEVLGVFDAYRKAEEIILNPGLDPFGFGEPPVGCQCGRTDERFDTPQAYGKLAYS